jgi:hypothetical protein
LIIVNSCTANCSNPPTANAGIDKTICANATASIAGVIGGSATSLTWTGGTGTYSPNNTTASITYTPSAAEKAAGFATLILTANDPDGSGPCVSATDTVKIFITALPSAGTISGSTAVCKSQSGLAYSVVNQSGITYTWTVPSGASITSGQGTNSIVVSYSGSAVSGTIGVTASNSCGSSNATLSVTVIAAPVTAPITGNTSVCLNQTGVGYSTPAQSGMTYTWTVPSGVNITAGAGTNSITTTWTSSAVSGLVQLQIGNSCGTLTSSTAVTVSSAPTTPTVTGTATLCAGATGVIYSITAQSGASYVWTVPANVTITGGQGTNSITTTWSANAVSGSVSVAVTKSCGTTNGSFAVTVNRAPTTPTITGNASVCPNTAGVVYSVVAQSGASYVWTVPANVAITGGQGTNSITTTWNANAVSGNVGVTLSNSCGNSSISFAVTVGTAPATTTITGSTLICGVQSQSGATYTWTVPANVSITSGQGTNSIVTSWAAGAASGNVGISITTNCGTTIGSLAVTKSNPPSTPTITGTANVCPNTTGVVYSVAAQSGVTYLWSIPSGVTITAGQGTNSITTTWGAGAVAGNVSVAISNTCGTVNANYAVTVGTGVNIGSVSGPVSICTPQTAVTYSVPAISGVSFTWTVPTGVSIVSGQGSNSIVTSWTVSAVSGNVTVVGTNSCGSGLSSLPVAINQGFSLGAITGTTPVCRPATGVVYSVPNQAGVTFTWTVPANVTITGGQGTNSITTNWSSTSTSGTVSVSATGGCGTASASLSVVVRTALPSTPGTVTGNSSACRGDVLIYKISKIATADYYSWIPSAGMLVNGSATAISIPDTFVTVTFLNTYVSDTLKVRSGNCKGLSNTY